MSSMIRPVFLVVLSLLDYDLFKGIVLFKKLSKSGEAFIGQYSDVQLQNVFVLVASFNKTNEANIFKTY